jgi:preprotein translocase subunit SecG
MFTFLLILQSLIAAAMVAVILMQRSEGGGLGVGGSPSGLMSARGAADFLTRATTILATLFIVLSIGLAGLATVERAPTRIDPSLSRQGPASAPLAPAARPVGDPLAGAASQAPANSAAGNGAVPLAQ